MDFKNKVVLITGASRGIGRATALAFAKAGANVVVNYFQAEPKDVIEKIKEIGSVVIGVKADISQEDQVKNLIAETISKFGRIDILVNNAGIAFDESYEDKTVEKWSRTLNVNLVGQFLTIKHAIPFLSDGAKIVNVSSTNAINAFSPEAMDYDASKAGVIVLTKDFAKILADKKILVNAIAPGWVNTDMNKDLPADFVESETDKIWLKRFAEPEEISHLVMFLSSDLNTFITGQVFIIDGGHD